MRLVLLFLMLIPTISHAQTKTDLFGFIPGMTHEQTKLVMIDRSYRCRIYKINYSECIIDGSKAKLVFSDELQGNPLVKIYVELPEGTRDAKLIPSVTAQYGVTPTKDDKGTMVWVLPKGVELKWSDQLSLIDPVLDAKDKAADKAAYGRGTPKF